MGLFVEIREGQAPLAPKPVDINNALIIGRSNYIPATNPFNAASMNDLSSFSTTTDTIAKAAQYYFSETNGNGGLWLYVISGAGETVSGAVLEGARDNSNTLFFVPYGDIKSIGAVKAKIDALDSGSGFITQNPTGYTTGVTEGILNGQITIGSSGIYYNSGGVGITGLTIGPNDFLTADVVVGNMGQAFNALLRNDIYFQLFTYAYDQSVAQPLAPATGTNHKYKSGNCYFGSGWLHDALNGAIMATNFNNVEKDTIFCYSLPSFVKPNNKITGSYANGTSYDGQNYIDTRKLVGQNSKVSMFSAKQSTDGQDIATAAMGTLMRDQPRQPLTTAIPETTTQVELPLRDEIMGWRAGQVNTFIEEGGFQRYANNYTFGNGFARGINYNRCVGLLKKRLRDILLAAIGTRQLKYDLDSVIAVENVIISVLNEYTTLKIIDGLPLPPTKPVEIPIKSYLEREATLNDADKLILLDARQSGILKDITVRFRWAGDIETIIISALIPV
jgi:hypothetical protein